MHPINIFSELQIGGLQRRIVLMEVFHWYMGYAYNNKSNHFLSITFKVAYEISRCVHVDDFHQDMFLMLAVRSHLLEKGDVIEYRTFMKDFDEVVSYWSCLEIVTVNELFNFLEDQFYRGRQGYYPEITNFMAQYKPCLPTL